MGGILSTRQTVLSVTGSIAQTPGPPNAIFFSPLTLLANPKVPYQPADRGSEAAPSNYRHGAGALLEDAHKADDEYNDGANMLDDDGRIGDQRPEVIWLDTGVALEVLQECRLVGVVVGVCESTCVSDLRRAKVTRGVAYKTDSPRAASGSASGACLYSYCRPCAGECALSGHRFPSHFHRRRTCPSGVVGRMT